MCIRDRLRRSEWDAVRALGAAGLAEGGAAAIAVPAAGSSGSVPVAWLAVPGNARGVGPADRAVVVRAAALEAAGDAIDAIVGTPALVHAHTGFPDGAAAAVE